MIIEDSATNYISTPTDLTSLHFYTRTSGYDDYKRVTFLNSEITSRALSVPVV
jgi:hypothetical protein